MTNARRLPLLSRCFLGATPALAGLMIALLPTVVLAAPTTIQVEGTLQSKGGGPVADGSYSMTFSLWDKATGGTNLWTEKATIKVSKGGFVHALGSVTPIAAAKLAGAAQWLGARVGTDPELPRRRLHAVTWAFHAKTAHGIGCTGCVGISALKADSDLNLAGRNLAADKVTAKTVVAQQLFGDGSKLTGIKIPSGACKQGDVVTGIAGDGSLKCSPGLDPKSLGADALPAVSGGQLTNKFSDLFPSKTAPRDIKDNNPSGITDVIDVPDVGTAKSVKVHITISGTSGIKGLKVYLFDPTAGPLPASIANNTSKATFILHDGGGIGPNLVTTFPPTKPAKGDLTKWAGKNPKGKWSLVIVDTAFKDNKSDGKLLSWAIDMETVSTKKIQATGTFVASGGFKLPVLAKPPYPCNAKWRGFTYVDAKTDAVHICRKSGLWGTFSVHECGNKLLESGETCDDGNHTNGDGCDQLCIKECGNGKIDKGEECDFNHAATKKNCTQQCKKLKYGKLWLESSWTRWYPVKYPHSSYSESKSVALCKSVGLRLWRDEGGNKNDPNWAYDYNGGHNLGGHDICYKVNSATSNSQQGHTGTWKVFSKTWADDLKLVGGCGDNQAVTILNHLHHSGSNESSSSYCSVTPNGSQVKWGGQNNGAVHNLNCAVVLCAQHK